MRLAAIAVIGVLCGLVAGCVETSSGGGGGMTSKLTGGLVGSKSKTASAGEAPSAVITPLYNAWVSSDLGRFLDDGDRRVAADADHQALENGAAGVTREWQGPHSGLHGQVTPGPAYSVNQYTCRDFVDAVLVDGRRETRRSTACRQPDGSWRPIS